MTHKSKLVQKFWLELCEDLSTWLKCNIPACPTLCVLGDLGNLNMEINTAHMVPIALSQENYSHELENKR